MLAAAKERQHYSSVMGLDERLQGFGLSSESQGFSHPIADYAEVRGWKKLL